LAGVFADMPVIAELVWRPNIFCGLSGVRVARRLNRMPEMHKRIL